MEFEVLIRFFIANLAETTSASGKYTMLFGLNSNPVGKMLVKKQ